MPADATQITVSSNGRRRGKLKLLCRDKLDRRTLASKKFDAIAHGIANDISSSGEDGLSTIQLHLVEAFAGVALHVQDLNAKLLLGVEVDTGQFALLCSVLTRLASRIGIDRRAVKDITPSLAEILAKGPP